MIISCLRFYRQDMISSTRLELIIFCQSVHHIPRCLCLYFHTCGFASLHNGGQQSSAMSRKLHDSGIFNFLLQVGGFSLAPSNFQGWGPIRKLLHILEGLTFLLSVTKPVAKGACKSFLLLYNLLDKHFV